MRNGLDSKRITLTLRPHEVLSLRIMAEANRISSAEVLRIGMNLLWRLYRRGRFKTTSWLKRRAARPNATQRRKPSVLTKYIQHGTMGSPPIRKEQHP